MPHPDLAAEQAHVDHAYERLAAMRTNALAMLRAAFSERGGTFQAITERDIRVRTSLNRLEQLQLGRESLVFGRIDRLAGGDGGGADAGAGGASVDGALADGGRARDGRVGGAIEAFHIGRLAVADEDQEPLVVDWRAPVAEPFYRATGAQPMGLTRRRHFLTEGQRVLDLEDELFGDAEAGESGEDDALGAGLGAGLSGSATLLAALSRSRTGRMRDIVATVQREQDEIIRGPLSGVLVVQGGPGTGKTAVALHRAAYLLYTYRFPLESQGVLVVGPNPLFLRYIEHVLPSLGESGVEMSTVGRLYGPLQAVGADERATATLKGEARMARFLARAVANRQRPLRRPVEIPYGSMVLTLSVAASTEIVTAAKRRAGAHNPRRRYVEQLLWRHLHGRYLEARARAPREVASDAPLAGQWSGATGSDEIVADVAPLPPPAELTAAELGNDLRRLPAVSGALDRMWPRLTPQELLHDLFGAPPLLELAGRGLLSEAEQALLARPRSATPESAPWTDADLALLDEARALLGSPRRRSGGPREGDYTNAGAGAGRGGSGAGGFGAPGGIAGGFGGGVGGPGVPSGGSAGVGSGADDDGPRSYGHIVVDEAQDLSPMQWRMLGRRSLSSSMTIVGDIAQATGTWAPRSWAEALVYVPTRRGSRMVELTVNYRTPSEVMDLAARVLEAAAPGVAAPESVRTTGRRPQFVPVAGGSDWASTVAAVVADEAVAVVQESQLGGTVGVVCAPSMVAAAADALAGRGVAFGTLETGALDDAITLVSVTAVKGLEFDSVVVVEPGRIVAESPQGLRALYVALTRATRRLSIVYAEGLPEPLSSGPTT